MIEKAIKILPGKLCIGALFLFLTVSFTHLGEARLQESIKPEDARLLAGQGNLWYASEVGAKWQRKPAPGEGRIESITTDPQRQGRVLLCRDGVVWISEDDGLTWEEPIFESFEQEGVTAAFHPELPDMLFVATNQRLLISNNRGKNWQPATPGLEFRWRPQRILVSDRQPERLYITTRGDGVFRSDDGGRSWISMNSGLPKGIGAAQVAAIENAVQDPTDADVIYVAAEARGIYKTTNGGATWDEANRGLPGAIMYRTSPWILAIDPLNPERLLVWASWPVHSERVDSAFFLSEDKAESWHKIAGGPERGRVFAIQFVDAKVGLAVALTEDGVMFLSN